MAEGARAQGRKAREVSRKITSDGDRSLSRHATARSNPGRFALGPGPPAPGRGRSRAFQGQGRYRALCLSLSSHPQTQASPSSAGKAKPRASRLSSAERAGRITPEETRIIDAVGNGEGAVLGPLTKPPGLCLVGAAPADREFARQAALTPGGPRSVVPGTCRLSFPATTRADDPSPKNP